MRCSTCQHDNEAVAVFCEECGNELAQVCMHCGIELKPTAKFCLKCGAQTGMSEPLQHAAARVTGHVPTNLVDGNHQSQPNLDGERKTITALFADLKGSTSLIEKLDPEAARALLDPALQIMMDAVHRYEGHVAQVLGDGIYALFGAPLAIEDHPQCALHAALSMQANMRNYADQVQRSMGVPLQARVGINTGEVFVRSIRKDDLHTDYVPVGHTIHLAARMEQMAEPGGILITEYTRRYCQDFFHLKSLGIVTVRGVEVPLSVYEVLGLGQLRTRFQAAAQRGLTRFVGRQVELEQLRSAYATSRTGHGRIIDIIGEPGIGKSRLVHEFKRAISPETLLLEAQAIAHGRRTPYLPLVELLKKYFQIAPADDDRCRREKIADKALDEDRSLEDTLPFLFSLLLVEHEAGALAQLGEQARRRRILDAVKRLLLRETRRQPVMLVVEVLHWIDTETEAALALLAESLASARFLLLTTYRPEYSPPWQLRSYYTASRLSALDTNDAEDLLDSLLGVKHSSDGLSALKEMRNFILAKTQGTPFFMEEVVQALFEQGHLVRDEAGRAQVPLVAHTPHAEIQIPATLEGVLAARIDRLPAAEKLLLQQIAVIGREFALELARHVIGVGEETLIDQLSDLQRREFVYEQPGARQPAYEFKHALTQDVAYRELPQERRKLIHERTAEVIETLYVSHLDEHYAALAHHYTQSDNLAKAIAYLRLAGHQANQRSAAKDAVAYLEAALVAVARLPESAARDQQEVDILIELGIALQVAAGLSATRVKEILLRAYALCRHTGAPHELFPVLAGLRANAGMRGESMLEYAEALTALGTRTGDSAIILHAHVAMAFCHFGVGDWVSAREEFDHALATYCFEEHRDHTVTMGPDAAVLSHAFGSLCLWMLGYPDTALGSAREASASAQRIGYPYMISFAKILLADLCGFRGEISASLTEATAAVHIADEYGFPEWIAFASPLADWARGMQGDANALSSIDEHLAIFGYIGATFYVPMLIALKAELQARAGQFDHAIATATTAVTMAMETNQLWILPELYRVRGALLLAADPAATEAAAQHFERARSMAQDQRAKAWELRATTSLARLWQNQGKHQAARALLAPIYGWFTEGFETRDLQEAKTLLEAR